MLFAGAECVADGEDARVEQADNIARVASLTMARSSAIRLVPVASLMFLPSCTWNASMPRSNLPEQMRRNAMRSRWFLFMLAWILKIKPLNCSLHGSTSSPLCASLRGSGVGVRRRNSFRNGSTPKSSKRSRRTRGTARRAARRRGQTPRQRRPAARCPRPAFHGWQCRSGRPGGRRPARPRPPRPS